MKQLVKGLKISVGLVCFCLSSFVYAGNVIHTVVKTSKDSTFGVSFNFGPISKFRFERCEGKSINGSSQSGQSCHFLNEIDDNAMGPIVAYSADDKSSCAFTLGMMGCGSKNKNTAKRIDCTEIVYYGYSCRGNYKSLDLKKVGAYDYQLIITEN